MWNILKHGPQVIIDGGFNTKKDSKSQLYFKFDWATFGLMQLRIQDELAVDV